jgi:hypothetical protein
MTTVDIDLGKYALGWSDAEDYAFKPQKGLNEEIIREMSRMKNEPEWMLQFRLKAYQRFLRKPVPTWGGGGALDDIDFDDIYYYIKPSGELTKDWDMVPESIKNTYEKLGIPEAERKYLAGVTARSSGSTSGRSSRPTTTSSPPSTRPCGPAGRSSTCRPGCTSTSRFRPTSGSTPRTWGSSSGR